ncbi:MAG TPA: histidine kinase [Gaiella sp.]|jgi:signal transduction histidine kinase
MSLHGRVTATDVAIGAAFVVAAELEVWWKDLTPTWLAASAFVVLGVAVALRRAGPLLGLVVGLGALLAAVSGGVSLESPLTPLFFFVLVLYNVGLREERAMLGLGVAGVLMSAVLIVAHQDGQFPVSDIPFVTVVVCTPWFVGYAMRGKLRRSDELERRAERLEHERATAVADERARIARELHDVIAHSVSVMVVQAGAAEEVLKRSPEAALEPLRAVQETGRQALVEMSRLVGLLRETGQEIGLTPQPRLDELEELVASVEHAGLPVSLSLEGDRRRLPLGIELTAYRVVQEALTNALKHAGEASAEVRVRYEPDALLLEVLDDGPGANGYGGGHGLAGMRERVGVFGGEVTAGPRASGGFAVRVRLPVEEAG